MQWVVSLLNSFLALGICSKGEHRGTEVEKETQ